jgi:hypothetical protein
MTTALDNNELLVSESCTNWWPNFVAETNATASMRTVDGQRIVTSSDFDATLLNFYNSDDSAAYKAYLTFTSTDQLRLSQIRCLDDGDERDIPYRTEQMDEMRNIADICSSVGAVAYGPAYWNNVSAKVKHPGHVYIARVRLSVQSTNKYSPF